MAIDSSDTGAETQVGMGHYFDPDYLHPGRLASYGHQFQQVHERDCQNLIEVGVGAGVLRYLLERAGFGVQTLDIDEELEPDIVGSVTNIPQPANSVDAVVGFQVLEHLPFEDFVPALREMKRVARNYVMISLPDVSRCYRFDNWFPVFGHVKFELRIPRINPPEHEYDGQHYWEMGKKGYSVARIKNMVRSAELSIEDSYRPWEYGYHHFFILRPKN
jgi:ubiquinone/menaquinone biosynthesis C-methylase UbiE